MTHFLDSLPFDWTAPGARELRDLLASSYDEPAAVKALAREAGIATQYMVWQQSAHGCWTELISTARNQDKLRTLLARIEQGPDGAVTSRLRELARDHPVLEAPEPESPPGTWKDFSDPNGLERQIFARGTFQDTAFLKVGAETATAVCRLLVQDAQSGAYHHGTGFRIGEDLLMTNHHVLYGRGGVPVKHAEAWFGYEQSLEGLESEYVSVALDLSSAVGGADDDWAVIRAAAPLPSDAFIIPLPERTTVGNGDRVYVIQHPQGGVKKLAARHNVVRHVDDEVVQYWTDTAKGSSGAPVFDEQWRLVALHRRHTEAGNLSERNEYRNEGVRIDRVVAAMARAGLR
ncbi:trypsin-like peptidase domain-containing protein [Streptomyces erythrochromogenes]|uniref:trypsin-like peptidase domain-containing protein n=1 Tax=Streptomyces erythrochromogenes TaxID=285574 RepID=UPI00386F7F17|nr:serine protease [Streptomyces erythrochromogenes]